MKRFLQFFILSILSIRWSFAKEPTAVNLTHQGRIDWVYYDFSNQIDLQPLDGLYMSGEGQIQMLRLNYQGHTFLINEWGQAQGHIQGPFQVELDNDGRLERFRVDYSTVLRFEYDFDGRLEEVRDGSFNTLFELDYNMDGSLDRIDKGGFDFFARFYYDLDDQLDGIKDDKFNETWDIDYGFDDQIEEIEDGSFKTLAEFQYHHSTLHSISDYGTNTKFYIGASYVDYMNGWVQESHANQGGWGNNNGCGQPTVQFFRHANYSGIALNYVSGELAELPLGWNDEISSITVPAGYLLIVYEHAFFGGSTRVIQNSWTVNDSQDWWNDRISSFKLIRI